MQNDFGECGQGSNKRTFQSPVLVNFPGNVVKFAAGEYHAGAVTDKGELFLWGLGSDGQIGDGAKSTQNTSPVHVSVAGEKFASVACGGGHTAAITTTGRLYVWGRGRDGQLGRADKVESVAAHRTTPQEVDVFGKGRRPSEIHLGSDFSVCRVVQH